MERQHLAQLLVEFGCPATKSVEMAAQLEKRAGQLVSERGWTAERALRHLLTLMREGWASPQGVPRPPQP